MKFKIISFFILSLISSFFIIATSCKNIPIELLKKCNQVNPKDFEIIQPNKDEVFLSIKCNPINYYEFDSIIISSCYYVASENNDTIRIICPNIKGSPCGYLQIIKKLDLDLKTKKLFLLKDSLNYKKLKTIYADVLFLRI